MEIFIIILILWVPLQSAFCFPNAQVGIYAEYVAGCPSFPADVAICCFMQLVLTVDIVFNFITSAVTHKGEEITSNKEIAMSHVFTESRRCLRMGFLCDVISAIPVVLLFIAERKYTHHVRLLRLLVMTKGFNLPILLTRLEDRLQLNIQYGELVNLILGFCLVSHIFGCMFYLFSDVHNAFTEDPHNSWIARTGMYEKHATPSDKYIITLYWFLATLFTVGYGDVVAVSSFERAFAIVAMVMGCVVYSFIIGITTQLLMRVGTHEQVFRNKMKEIDAFLQAHDVPVALQVRHACICIYPHGNTY